MTTGKLVALTKWTFVGKVMFLCFNMLSRLVITFLPRSKCFLISWLQSQSSVILEPPQIKSLSLSQSFHCFPIYFPWSDGTRCHDLSFLNADFKPTFSLSSFTFIKRLLLTFCHKGGVICISGVIDISPGNLDSSLCFCQPSISHDVLCIEVK